MIISFGWTTAALLAGDKTCTRRVWSRRHMAVWQKAWDEGRLIHDAWNRQARYGGKPIGRIKLTCRPYWERLGDMHPDDLVAEGGLWMSIEEFVAMFPPLVKEVAVVRFDWLGEGS